jgi:protein TonB
MVLVSLPLVGCYTSSVAPDTASRANDVFRDAERNPKAHTTTEQQKEDLIRLWADTPDYVMRLRREKNYVKMPRLVSAVPPSYPVIPLLSNVKATVSVAFVVDERGTVEAARVFESSDSRFDQPAVEAVKKWKFLPAEFDDGPTKGFLVVPVQFDVKK